MDNSRSSRGLKLLALGILIWGALGLIWACSPPAAWCGGYDMARAVAVDSAGNVIVTGLSKKSTSENYDYLTIKYDPAGTRLWSRRYTGVLNDESWGPKALAVDSLGNVYIAGTPLHGSGFYGFVTIKYTPSGDVGWVKTYDGEDSDYARTVAVGPTGRVHAVAKSGNFHDYDFVTIKYPVVAGLYQALGWTRRYNSGKSDIPTSLTVDGSGNVYVVGYSSNGTDDDFRTIKYSSAGTLLWNKTYVNAHGDDWPYDVGVDASGNVYVTGASWNDTGSDFLTVKYASDGNWVWTRRLDSTHGFDIPLAMAVNSAGNAHVTGCLSNAAGNWDFRTIKYRPNGTIAWQRGFDGGGGDVPYAIALDGSGNVYVTGYSENSAGSTKKDFFTMKYTSTGTKAWSRRLDGGFQQDDTAKSIAVDAGGNVYVAGYSSNGANYDYMVVKYTPEGTPAWTRRNDSP
jgi:uncharacterized delta-60 repeat protein